MAAARLVRNHPRPLRHRHFAGVLLALVAMLTAVVVAAPPASAQATLTITHQSNNTWLVTINGHRHVCYYGDLCIGYPVGDYSSYTFASYYVCQTFSVPTNIGGDASGSFGYAVNNQSGSGGVATFYGKSGFSNQSLPTQVKATVQWDIFYKVRTCT